MNAILLWLVAVAPMLVIVQRVLGPGHASPWLENVGLTWIVASFALIALISWLARAKT
jgi:hypothetical protein